MTKSTTTFLRPLEWVRIGIGIALCFLVILVITQLVLFRGVVVGASMEPLLDEGGEVLGNQLAFKSEAPRRGDVIVFSHEGHLLVKRIIGLPGDQIVLGKDGVYLNGLHLDEPYLKEPMNVFESEGETFKVPLGSYFVLGDNRNQSQDSRFWSNPYVPESAILAKVWCQVKPGFKGISPFAPSLFQLR